MRIWDHCSFCVMSLSAAAAWIILFNLNASTKLYYPCRYTQLRTFYPTDKTKYSRFFYSRAQLRSRASAECTLSTSLADWFPIRNKGLTVVVPTIWKTLLRLLCTGRWFIFMKKTSVHRFFCPNKYIRQLLYFHIFSLFSTVDKIRATKQRCENRKILLFIEAI